MEKEKPLPLSRALNFAATGFMHCASTVHDRIIQNNIPREHVIWIGMQQNIGQAFEGAMKCYLASKGATENELFNMGHKLDRLVNQCRVHGIKEEGQKVGQDGLLDAMEKITTLIGPDYRGHNFRYLKAAKIQVFEGQESVPMVLRVVACLLAISDRLAQGIEVPGV